MAEIRELTQRQCEERLAAGAAGRVAISTPNGPHIVPVNYSLVDDAIVVRTTPYSLLGTYARNTTFAFEIDGFDEGERTGWSVHARGRVEVVTDRVELDRIREVAEPTPWAAGARVLFLRLRWAELTGRELGNRAAASRDVSASAGS